MEVAVLDLGWPISGATHSGSVITFFCTCAWAPMITTPRAHTAPINRYIMRRFQAGEAGNGGGGGKGSATSVKSETLTEKAVLSREKGRSMSETLSNMSCCLSARSYSMAVL